MKDPDVLAALRDHVRADRADDDALEAVARGEQASSAALALEARSGTNAEVRAMIDASRPLGAAKLDAIADAVRVTPAAPAAAKPSGRNVVAFLRRASIVVGPLALAAALFLVVGRGGNESTASLPEYSFVASGEKEMRGDSPPETARALRLRSDPDATFEIVARPATAAGGHVVAYVFAVIGGEPNAVDARVELAPGGSVRIRGRAAQLHGAGEIRVVLGTANDSIKRYEDALARAREGRSDASIRVLVVPVMR